MTEERKPYTFTVLLTEKEWAPIQAIIDRDKEQLQDVPDSQWEVIEYKMKNSEQLWTHQGNDEWESSIYKKDMRSFTTGEINLIYENGGTEIHAIRIKGTSEVFRVGDKIVWDWATNFGPENGYYTIQRFRVNKDNELCIQIQEEKESEYTELDEERWNLRHYVEPKPILVTVDGKDVYDRDQLLYGVDPVWSTTHGRPEGITTNTYLTSCKWFSTAEKRDEWVKHNKPVLSLEEVNALLRNEEYGRGSMNRDEYKARVEEQLEQLVQTKMKNE